MPVRHKKSLQELHSNHFLLQSLSHFLSNQIDAGELFPGFLAFAENVFLLRNDAKGREGDVSRCGRQWTRHALLHAAKIMLKVLKETNYFNKTVNV